MGRFFKTGALVVAIAVLALYLGDLLVFSIRVKHGSGYGTVEVNQFLKTPLKGQKEEFDVIGTDSVTCARALFPRSGMQACWWLQRHANQWQ